MCTSITYQTSDDINFLARTMDFGFELEGVPTIFPRRYPFPLDLGGELMNRYGYLGTGRKLDKFIFADGVNENGVAIAELYFPREAQYAQELDQTKINLAPHEFISWVLGEMGSIVELKQRINEVSIMASENSLLEIVLPLHFIVTDSTGEVIVVEPMEGQLQIKNNPVKVMTNSPEFEWHLKNLNNYLGLQPHNFHKKYFGTHPILPFGQGSGTFGLPGGYTSPERFIRAAYLREYTPQAASVNEGLMNILHILGNVRIPRGVDIEEDGSDDYTQYIAIFNTNEQIYYLQPEDTNALLSVHLTEELLELAEPKVFKFQKGPRLEWLK